MKCTPKFHFLIALIRIKRFNIKFMIMYQQWHVLLSSLWFFNHCSSGPLSPLSLWADVNNENMTQNATWIQYLALLMWYTDTKESVPIMVNSHDAIILSKSFPSTSEPQIRKIDFSIWTDPNKWKHFYGEISYWCSFNKLYCLINFINTSLARI